MWQLLTARRGGWAAAGRFAGCCTAGEQARAKKRRGDPMDRLVWSTCLAVSFSKVSLRPTRGPALPSPRARAQATTWGPVLLSMGEDVLCTRRHWRSCWACKFGRMWSSFSYSNPQPSLNLFLWTPKEFPAFNDFCNGVHKGTTFWSRNLLVCTHTSHTHGRDFGTSHQL